MVSHLGGIGLRSQTGGAGVCRARALSLACAIGLLLQAVLPNGASALPEAPASRLSPSAPQQGPAGAPPVAAGQSSPEPVPEPATPAGAQNEDDPLERAETMLARGDYTPAQALLAGLLSRDALLLKARLQLEVGDYALAEATAQRAAAEQTGLLRAQADVIAAEALLARGQRADGQRLLQRSATAAPVHTATGQRARVLLGRLLIERGERARGERQLRVLTDAYNRGALGDDRGAALAYVAMAAQGLSAFHDANRAFADSIAARPGHVETLLSWAELFIAKDDKKQALESVEIAIKYNPRSPWARTLLARLKMDSPLGFATASEEISLALSVNPHFVPALVTRAAMALRSMDIPRARESLAQALARNPTDLEALSTAVAIEFLSGDQAAQARAEAAVLRVNRRFSGMYSIVARFAEWEHRYADLVTLARKALSIDKDDATAYATLGINLLRAGQDEEGLAALREAWDRDRFNVRVFHVLNLYDQVIKPNYVEFDAAPFRFRVHKEERVVLQPYAPPLAKKAYETMAKRYGIRPAGPLRIEMYASQEDFSMRTTGMPNVGVQGVCFGRVITAVSPRAGEYNWGQILWHELAHVFHLQLSNSRVPRWFTEGLAEYETAIARPEWSRHDDRGLYRALRKGSLPVLSRLSEAFTYARSSSDLMLAYHTATVAVQFLVERFGEDKVLSMLPAWGRGLSTEEVLREILDSEAADLDAAFATHLGHRLARFSQEFSVDIPDASRIPELRERITQAPRSADARAALALALVGDGQFDRGMRAVRAALYFQPTHPGAHFARSRVALERGNMQGAHDDLMVILKTGHDGVLLRRMLTHAAKALGELSEALEHVRAAIALDPSDVASQRLLFRLALDADDRSEVVKSLHALAELDPHDRSNYGMLLAALASRDPGPELVRIGEAALYVDPASPMVHLHLGHGYAKVGRLQDALAEYEQALVLGPVRPARVHFGRALVLSRMGRHAEGEAALAQAIALEPGLLHALERATGDDIEDGASPAVPLPVGP